MNAKAFVSSVQSTLQKAKDVKDEEKLYKYNGVLYPLLMCPEVNLKALENFRAREDDIMLVAYPKCGFNWMVEVVRKIIEEATGMEMDRWIPPLIEFFGPDVLKVMEETPSPRFLGTHLHPDNLPASFEEKKTKMLVLFRNPKDTLVSFYHFSNNYPIIPSESWESFYSHFLSGDVPWGSYFEHALAWEKKMDDPNVMIVTYEELKQDLSEGVRQITTFFGFSLTEAQVQQISDGSTFSAMKENSINSHGAMGNILFRKGEVGDWRNHFTPEQSQQMDDAFNKHLAGTRLGAKLNYQQHCQ
ncbi:sulfotransferase 6B1-like [Cottoperca gobio]|uniref:Sulfotransferase n=1 Tax=Cottoperca gobio TaxID=56716 RepID=A0A6J2P9R7_COTGO|nr:sulfotransferase 6B1-like [Cottoperca gobio]